MTTAMGPPPPRNPSAADAAAGPLASESASTAAMFTSSSISTDSSETEAEPESYRNHREEPQLNPPVTHSSENATQSSNSTDSGSSTSVDVGKEHEQSKSNEAVPYTIPAWSGPPCHPFFLEVLKDGVIVNKFDVNEKGAYMFGRVDLCDFVLEHPTISRFHAVLQFKSGGDAYLYDLGSTHGTFINKCQVKKRVFVDLHVGDVIRFGHSSRLYIFQGPSELMLPEADSKSLRDSKRRLDMQDMEASLLRTKVEASRADGISWGMREDAVEEMEDEINEITWQTYKGVLTEKQEKTREKVIRRLEEIAHMKKEINAIRAKDIAQGGLTQGQQTQIARNEQRISQIMEELENLEETLNDSIRESMGARAGKLPRGERKRSTEGEEDYLSDDVEFYDRTQKPSKQKSGEDQSVETADSLLDKKDAIIKKMEDQQKLLDKGKAKQTDEVAVAGDALDAYMSAVSPQLDRYRSAGQTSPLRMASGKEMERDHLAESLNDLFASVSSMIKGELQRTNNVLELLENMNARVAEEYRDFGDVASGLRVFVEQLKSKSSSFDEYVQQIDAIEQQVIEFEAVVSMLDKYVSMLESKMQSVYQIPPS